MYFTSLQKPKHLSASVVLKDSKLEECKLTAHIPLMIRNGGMSDQQLLEELIGTSELLTAFSGSGIPAANHNSPSALENPRICWAGGLLGEGKNRGEGPERLRLICHFLSFWTIKINGGKCPLLNAEISLHNFLCFSWFSSISCEYF